METGKCWQVKVAQERVFMDPLYKSEGRVDRVLKDFFNYHI